MSLKLGPIPDRRPVKLRLTLQPHVHEALSDYAALHERHYGRKSTIHEIAALALEKFMDNDPTFKRERKTLHSAPNEKAH